MREIDTDYADVVLFTDYSYDSALVGVTTDNRAVYDYDKMVAWLVDEEGFTEEDAVDWISDNTIRSLDYAGADAPLIMYRIDDPDVEARQGGRPDGTDAHV